MLDWILGYIDLKGIVTGVLGTLVGVFIKWLLDRKEKARLRADITAQKAETKRLALTLEKTHERLAEQEKPNSTKQAELDKLSALLDGKGIDIQGREDRLTHLLATLRDGDDLLTGHLAGQYPYIGELLKPLDDHPLAAVGKPELFAIANRYRNKPSGATHVVKFKSLKQARSSIRDVFLERADAQSKRGAIERLTKRAS